ncbi:hypothetical protein A2U01_0097930, partial [Trifolium medium]|nr:hypothetical protein [Trifolium medium]
GRRQFPTENASPSSSKETEQLAKSSGLLARPTERIHPDLSVSLSGIGNPGQTVSPTLSHSISP